MSSQSKRGKWASNFVYTFAVFAFVALVASCLNTQPHPLAGKTAPDVTLQTLDGESVQLAELKGDKVVLLDFWASWCPPCRKGMPIIEDIAQDYNDQDLAVYAVNVGEDRATVERFLRETGLDLPVALDTGAGEAYQVSGIPQTVIIDKQGQVAAVHVGISSGMDQELRAEIDALLGAQ